MPESIPAKCDQCGHEFSLTEFKKRKLADDIEQTYFICPECDHEFTCFYTDRAIRKRQAKMKQMINAFARDQALKRIKKDTAALKKRMEGEANG